VLKQSLYTLVYDERSRIGKVREGKRDGLTVVTPFEGTYLQFDGRRGRDDIKETEPQRLKDAVATTYISDALFELEASGPSCRSWSTDTTRASSAWSGKSSWIATA
jgi:hypothetical protein